MADTTLGKLVNGSDVDRDAIHVAVKKVQSTEALEPGQRIGLVPGLSYNRLDYVTKAGMGVKALGIVDPFLTEPVQPGNEFLMVLFPQSITGLQHVWQHPDFD